MNSLCNICKKKQQYNGWSNYDTWNIALLIDNDSFVYDSVWDLVKDSNIDSSDNCFYDLIKSLKDFVIYDFLNYDDLDSNQQQMMMSSIDNIDWNELIKHYMEE
jgi:hypothetical protein